jgi:hypothetical protein
METKRTSDNLGSNNEPNSKRLKSNNKKPKDEEEKEHPVIQGGLCAAEMMAAHVVRQNVISIIRSKSSKRQMSIALISRARRHPSRPWYFDRQDAIQCSGFNFIQDLPRFMVLLLIMQRLPCVEWGLHPLYACATVPKPKIEVEDKDLGSSTSNLIWRLRTA